MLVVQYADGLSILKLIKKQCSKIYEILNFCYDHRTLIGFLNETNLYI